MSVPRPVGGASPAAVAASSATARALIAAVSAYRAVVAPWLPSRCRFAPSCSTYAIEAIATHGAVTGGALAARRVARCHPWHAGGYDPVPASSHAARRPPAGVSDPG